MDYVFALSRGIALIRSPLGTASATPAVCGGEQPARRPAGHSDRRGVSLRSTGDKAMGDSQGPWSPRNISAGLFIQIIGGIIAGVLTFLILTQLTSNSNNITDPTTYTQPQAATTTPSIIKGTEASSDRSIFEVLLITFTLFTGLSIIIYRYARDHSHIKTVMNEKTCGEWIIEIIGISMFIASIAYIIVSLVNR
jgi:hypothetical protein